MTDTKRCPRCGRTLPVTHYHRDHTRKDGLCQICRDCVSERDRRAYESGDQLATRLGACERSPTRRNAYAATMAALKAGRLKRPDRCGGCGCHASLRRIEAHHHDYSKPLDVIWLCTRCHRRIDMLRREQEAIVSGEETMARSGAPTPRKERYA